MRWRDLSPAPGVGPWQGLDLEIAPADLPDHPDHPRRTPGLRIEAATPGRIRVACGGTPALWARVHRWHNGLWRYIAPRADSWEIVPPIRSADIAAIDAPPGSEAWWKDWAREAARTLVASPRSPLHPGRWILSAARATDLPAPPLPGPPPADLTGLGVIEAAREALAAPDLAWVSWWLNGSGALLRMRTASTPDAARVKVWTKHATRRSLPPALVLFVTGLDLFLLLDGHDRLRAAERSGAPLGFLVLWPVEARPRLPDPARQAAVVREIERKRGLAGARRPLSVDQENRLLVDAFDDRPWLGARTRAFRLAGGAAAWDAELAQQSGVPPAHPIFSGEPPPRD